MEWLDTILKLSQVGSAALLMIALWGAVRGWWVPRWLYDKEAERADSFEALYEREKGFSEQRLAKLEAERERDQGLERRR